MVVAVVPSVSYSSTKHVSTLHLRNMYVSEKEPRMVISSPKIFAGGHETLAESE